MHVHARAEGFLSRSSSECEELTGGSFKTFCCFLGEDILGVFSLLRLRGRDVEGASTSADTVLSVRANRLDRRKRVDEIVTLEKVESVCILAAKLGSCKRIDGGNKPKSPGETDSI